VVVAVVFNQEPEQRKDGKSNIKKQKSYVSFTVFLSEYKGETLHTGIKKNVLIVSMHGNIGL
jgi:hypothetical protein